MRAFVMFISLALAVPCYAEDPLESLNTVEDTLSTMEQTLKLRGEGKGSGSHPGGRSATERLPQDDQLVFVSDQPLGTDEWMPVRPCTEEVALARVATDAEGCVWQPDGTVDLGGNFWRSRPAARHDLRVGVFVVGLDEAPDGAWFLARVTDICALDSGYVATSAPFRTPLKGLRVVE